MWLRLEAKVSDLSPAAERVAVIAVQDCAEQSKPALMKF